MQSAELILGRTFGITLNNGEDFFDSLAQFCQSKNISQAYIPSFLGGFEEVEIIGTCEKLEDPTVPSFGCVHLECLEAVGSGSLAYDVKKGKITPHIHVSVGLRPHSSVSHSGHLVKGKVLFLTEILLLEVLAPSMQRITETAPYSVLHYINKGTSV